MVIVRFARVWRAVLCMGHPLVRWSLQMMTQDGGTTAQWQGDHERCWGSTTKLSGMWDFRSEEHPLVLGVQVRTLRDHEPILDRIVERRQFMNVDVVGVLAPTDRRGRPQLTLKVEFAQIERDNRRAVFDGRADESVLVPLRDSRLKLHLHCNCPPIPFVTIDLPVDK